MFNFQYWLLRFRDHFYVCQNRANRLEKQMVTKVSQRDMTACRTEGVGPYI